MLHDTEIAVDTAPGEGLVTLMNITKSAALDSEGGLSGVCGCAPNLQPQLCS